MKNIFILLLCLFSLTAFSQGVYIGDLPAASALGGTEVVAGEQGGGPTTVKITTDQLRTFTWTSPILTGLTTVATIKITDGSPGAGKVLTSDADGDATWETPSGGGSSLNTLAPNIQTGATYTVAATDTAKIIYMRHASTPQTATIPSGLKVGSVFTIAQDSTAVTTIACTGCDLIGATTLTPREVSVWHHRETGKYVRLGSSGGGGGGDITSSGFAFSALTDAATVAWSVGTDEVVSNRTVALGGNRTFGAPTGMSSGFSGNILVTASGANRTINIPAGATHKLKGVGDDTQKVISILSGQTFVVSWLYDGTNWYWWYVD